jgi:hypothetical protein
MLTMSQEGGTGGRNRPKRHLVCLVLVAVAVLVLSAVNLQPALRLNRNFIPKTLNAQGDNLQVPTNPEDTSVGAAVERAKPKGVFVLKVQKAQHAAKTLCSLTRFFNAEHKYPVRIFADYNYTDEVMKNLEALSEGADVAVVVDTQRWRKLPPTLTESEEEKVRKHCSHLNMTNQKVAMCTTLEVPLSYVYMGYWRYMIMADEPALKEFEYFVSMDADAFLTTPMPDPFEVMAINNLTGFFNIEAFQAGDIAAGIQEAAEKVFGLEERRNRFLDSERYSYFDDAGQWGGPNEIKPSIWGCFYGGRLDFFANERYKKFARLMVPSTYTFRTDEQAVIGVAWSLLADKVWYLPNRGIQMGVYHHGWRDNAEIVRVRPDDNQHYEFHVLEQWSNFSEIRDDLLDWESYVGTLGHHDHGWKECLKVCGKECDQ